MLLHDFGSIFSKCEYFIEAEYISDYLLKVGWWLIGGRIKAICSLMGLGPTGIMCSLWGSF